MSPLKIRKATLNDFEDILALNHNLFELESEKFDPGLNMEWTFSELGREYFTKTIQDKFAMVAVDTGGIIGYLAGSANIKNPILKNPYAELENMYVKGIYRGRGIGKLLYDEFKKYCLSMGAKEIRVTALVKNTEALGFYKSRGFEPLNMTLKIKIEA